MFGKKIVLNHYLLYDQIYFFIINLTKKPLILISLSNDFNIKVSNLYVILYWIYLFEISVLCIIFKF